VHRRVTDPTLSGTFVDTTGCTKDGSKPIRGQRMPGDMTIAMRSATASGAVARRGANAADSADKA
jgi:hypothetical protein